MKNNDANKRTVRPKTRLRQEREKRDLTCEQLAEKIGVPDPGMVGRWERGENRISSRYRQKLSDFFKLSSEALELLDTPLSSEQLPGEDGDSEKPNNLPIRLEPIIGRKREIEDISALLMRDDIRLITLSGMSGIGKTHLAIAVANQVLDSFTDGVCFVPLESIFDAEDVISSIAMGLHITGASSLKLEQQVRAVLRNKKMLLFIDNFEYVIKAAPLLERLLHYCPSIKILVTSIQALHIPVEQQFLVTPLSLPAPTLLPALEDMHKYGGIALFVERVQRQIPTFKLTADNAADIVALCARLDGIPLSIELAAAAIKIIPPPSLLKRPKQDMLHVLKKYLPSAPERHRSPHAMISWNYMLLTHVEQYLFRSFSVFVGGATLATLETFFGSTSSHTHSVVLEGIHALVESSLLQRHEQGENEQRFSMPGTIRSFAEEQLHIHREFEERGRAFALYHLDLVETAAPHLKQPEQPVWLEMLEQEINNLRSALQWLIEHQETELALRYVEAFGKFCGLYGYWDEEQRNLQSTLALPQAQQQPVYGRVVRRAGHLAYRLRNWSEAMAYLQESADYSRKVGDWSNLAGTLSAQARIYYKQGAIEHADALSVESVTMARQSEDSWSIANTLESRGHFLYKQHRLDEAHQLLRESIKLARNHLDPESCARILTTLVKLEIALGHAEPAEAMAQESLHMAQDLNATPLIALAIDTLGKVALSQGAYERASSYYATRSELAEKLGDTWSIARSTLNLADIALLQNDSIRAHAFVQQALLVLQKHDHQTETAHINCILGDIARLRGDTARASSLYKEALLSHDSSQHRTRCLLGLAYLQLDQDRAAQAVKLFSATEIELHASDLHLQHDVTLQEAKKRARTLLSDDAYQQAWTQGQESTLAQLLSEL